MIGEVVIRCEGLSRSYGSGENEVHALIDAELEVRSGELLVLRGPSGSGKTTLLNLLGGLDRPTDGWVEIDGSRLDGLDDDAMVALRRGTVAYVFQSFGLLPILSAAENVEVPLRLVRAEPRERAERIRRMLEVVGLGDRADHRPHELSGGEQQRVAIARALANRPQLLLADEPTGQLDSHTGRSIMALLQELVRSEGLTAIVATHDRTLIDLADQVIELQDGQVVS